LLKESSLISLASLIPLTKECSWSLEVTGLWKCVKDPSIESTSPSIRVAGMEYVVDQDLGSSG